MGQRTVDVLGLPQMALVTRLTAASLRTLAGMLNTLADTLAQVEVVDNKEVEVEDKEEAENLSERIIDFEAEADGEDHLRTDPETGLRLISLDEVRDHCTMEDGWMVLYDRVYQVSNLLRLHPGGEEVMAEYLGYDATIAFQGVGHSKAASRMLQSNLIGILPQEDRLNFT